MLVPVADLVGQPGATRPLHRVIAVGDVGDEPWGPAEELLRGSLTLDLGLDSVVEGIWVHGTVAWQLEVECGRCLRAVELDRDADVGELFCDPLRVEDRDDVDEGYTILADSGSIDLERMLHDIVVLDLPTAVRCERDDCELPVAAGVIVLTEDEATAAAEAAPDPRWAALADIDLGEG